MRSSPKDLRGPEEVTPEHLWLCGAQGGQSAVRHNRSTSLSRDMLANGLRIVLPSRSPGEEVIKEQLWPDLSSTGRLSATTLALSADIGSYFFLVPSTCRFRPRNP